MATKGSKKAPNRSARYFEYTDDKSSIFWEIQVMGDSFSVRSGKVGTAGKTNVKVFADAAAATKRADKLVLDKRAMCYVEQKMDIIPGKESSVESMSILRFEDESSIEEFEGVEGDGYTGYELDGKNCDDIDSLEFAEFGSIGLCQQQEHSLVIRNFKNVRKIYLDETHDFSWIDIDNLTSLEAVVVRGNVRSLYIMNSPKLQILDLTNCSRLEKVSCDSQKISSLNLDGCVKLAERCVEPLILRKLSIEQIKKNQSKSRLDGALYEDMTITDVNTVLMYINEGRRIAADLGFIDDSAVEPLYIDFGDPDEYYTGGSGERYSHGLGDGGSTPYGHHDLEDCLDGAMDYVNFNIFGLEDGSAELVWRFLKYIVDRVGAGLPNGGLAGFKEDPTFAALLAVKLKEKEIKDKENEILGSAVILSYDVAMQLVTAKALEAGLHHGSQRNPSASLALLEIQARVKEVNVRILAAENPSTPVALLEILAKDRVHRVLTSVLENPSTPVTLLKIIAKERYKVKDEDADAWARQYVARNPSTPIALLEMLAKNEDKWVRSGVAFNPSSPVALLKILVKEENGLIRASVAQNPSTPVALLERLAKYKKYESEREDVAANPSTPVSQLEMLAQDRYANVRNGVAENPSSPVALLNILVKDKDESVRESVAANPSASLALLESLAKSKNERVRIKVASNSSTPLALLQILAKDENKDVRTEAMANLFCWLDCSEQELSRILFPQIQDTILSK